MSGELVPYVGGEERPRRPRRDAYVRPRPKRLREEEGPMVLSPSIMRTIVELDAVRRFITERDLAVEPFLADMEPEILRQVRQLRDRLSHDFFL